VTLRLQHRFRLEQRFIGQMVPADGDAAKLESWRYQNRFRSFLRAEVPGAGVFDQNRAYAAVGYMNQIVARRNSAIRQSNHTLQIAFFSNLPFGK
jgi:hypothetical protein